MGAGRRSHDLTAADVPSWLAAAWSSGFWGAFDFPMRPCYGAADKPDLVMAGSKIVCTMSLNSASRPIQGRKSFTSMR